ncbi:hypothetical protein MesoLjLc_45460 [Mesorhizobium sp. L-8-10]|uniref:hypothetical protein n=1 Tax=Mesorhizobium sp. L-8-10 TaxID=2744523 RepID=UPI001929646C|nr:hypothetical protein [Mesorhizobium sp. L-8-10]BCH32616.1 hypothetical protein MesoLjLc_45460 [Mesorhizobium sp. L-8-10]
MADAGKILDRIRAHGANVMLDGPKLVIVNREKLPAGALDFIRQHGKEIAAFLGTESEFEERAAIIEFDGGLSRPAAEYLTHLLLSSAPTDISPADWTWFVGKASQVLDSVPMRSAA